MNIRQQKYKANRIKGMNQYNAAKAAGYSETFSRQACRVEKLVKVSMADAFEQVGITDSYLAKHALDGLNANKVISANVISSDGEGMKDANSMTKDFIEVPDWQARHKYYETVSKMSDRMKEKIEHTGRDGSPLPTPVIIINNGKNNNTATENRVLCSRESVVNSEHSGV